LHFYQFLWSALIHEIRTSKSRCIYIQGLNFGIKTIFPSKMIFFCFHFHFFPVCIYFTLLTSISSFSFVLSLFPFTFSSFSPFLFLISPQMTSADSSCLEGGGTYFPIYTPLFINRYFHHHHFESALLLYLIFILHLFYIYFITLMIIVLLNALAIIIACSMYSTPMLPTHQS
jgi:hypothetical protein